MNINKGLNLDTNPRDVEHESWKHARNMLLSKGFQSLENEGGFDPSTIDFENQEVKGWITTPTCVIFFTLGEEYDSHVYKYDLSSHSITHVKSFDATNDRILFKHLITGVYTYNIKKELVVVWCDGLEDDSNEILTMNIDNPSTVIDDYFFNPVLYASPRLVVENIKDSSSRLKAGTYYFAIAGVLSDGSRTAFDLISDKVLLYEFTSSLLGPGNPKAGKLDEVIRSSIRVRITRIFQPYDKYILAIIFKDGIATTVHTIDNIFINLNESKDITIKDLSKLIPASIQDVILPVSPYIKGNSLATVVNDNASQLLIGGVTYPTQILSWEQGQMMANRVVITYDVVDRPLDNNQLPTDRHMTPTRQDGEVYAFYLGVRDKKGNILGIWHICSRNTVTSSLPNRLEEHLNSNELYPNNFPNVDIPLANTPVRHFKVPDLSVTDPTFDPYFKVIKFTAHSDDFLNPDFGEFFILQAKRNLSNHRVIGSDVIHSFYWHTANTKNTEFGRGHCFDLMLTKSSLTSINNVQLLSYGNKAYSGGIYNVAIIPYVLDNHVGPHSGFTVGFGILKRLTLTYIPNDTTVNDNKKGESHISIEYGDAMALYFSQQSYSLNKDTKMRVRYLNSSFDYYFDYKAQDLMVVGKYTRNMLNSNTIELEGDTYYNPYSIRLTNLNTITGDDKDENTIKMLSTQSAMGLIPSALRVEGGNAFEKIFPLTQYGALLTNPDYPASKDNFLDSATGLGFNMGYNTVNDFYQGVSDPDVISIDSNPNIIAKSDVFGSEASYFGWRSFKINSYYLMPAIMGYIVNLISDGFNLYIQLLYELFIAKIKDVLSFDEGSAYLASGDIFDRPPRPILLSEDGHIGCQHKLHSRLTPFGYLCADRNKERVILVTGDTPSEISNVNSQIYLANKLRTNDVRVGFDYINRRVFIHFVNDGDSISFNVQVMKHISFHDYSITNAISMGNHVLYLVDNRLTRYTPDNNYGRYGDYIRNPIDANVKDSFVDIYYAQAITVPKLLQSLSWKTISNLNNIDNFEDTIDYIMLYNDTQCTGILTVNKNQMFFDSETGVLINGTWYYNKIEDVVINNRLPILDDKLYPIPTNVDLRRKDWYDISNFICDWAVSRLGISNAVQRKIILNFAEIVAQKDSR